MTDIIEETLSKYNKGLVFVYTGNGKGKTTAAMGQVLRAVGHGLKVMVIQFMKGKKYGEVIAAEKFLPRCNDLSMRSRQFCDEGEPCSC